MKTIDEALNKYKFLAESQDAEDSSVFLNFMLEHHKEKIVQQIKDYEDSIGTN